MKESSATDNNNNNNSLIVEEKDEEATSGVQIIATDTEESLSSAEVVIGHQNRNRNFTVAVGSLVVAAGVLGIAFYGGHSIRSSKQQVVAALNNVVEEVKGYEFVANGRCLDGSAEGGNRYDYIVFADDITGPQDCGERCSGCPGKGQADLEFLGFEYSKGSSNCWCLVDDDATLVALKGACEDDDGADAGWSGKGEIQGADGSTGYVCYKKSEGGKSKSSKRGKANNEAGGM